jgi:hypothetical protein
MVPGTNKQVVPYPSFMRGVVFTAGVVFLFFFSSLQ